MPRETVKDTNQLYNIEVGWSNGTVQLGLETETLESLLKVLSQNYDNPDGPNSIWASLNRTTINRLIRLLRKARDGAYGADA